MVQTTIFKNAYRTLRLHEVSKVVLATNDNNIEVGKYRGLTGEDIQTLQLRSK